MTAPYQLFGPLTAEEYAALWADIAARGIRVPVDVDENGAILDGHHRVAIAAELSIEAPTVTRAGMSEAQKCEHVLKLDLLRRPMTMSTKSERTCIECGEPIRFGRADRLTCSTACRSRRSRRRRGVSHGWGGATDRAVRRSRSRGNVAVAGR